MKTIDVTKTANEIVEWLKVKLDDSKQKGFVVGLSGGVDSALVATLATMTGKDVFLVNIPMGKRTGGCDRADNYGVYLAENYSNVTYNPDENLGDVATLVEEHINPFVTVNNENYDLARANMQSRLRMTYLYMYANLTNSLVLGTGNKVEDFGLYFYTKYGDGGVDLSPIADLYKSEVREMARQLGVPDEITTAVPSDELWDDNRSDEDQLGGTYDEFEAIMRFIDGEGDYDLTIERNKIVMDRFVQWNTSGMHKGVPIPIFKVSRS